VASGGAACIRRDCRAAPPRRSDELIIDRARYRVHPDCRTLICLVYDPHRRCYAPDALENDLTSEDGEFRMHVVVCPKGL
jgi:hypothetical protein